jgi:hypothetical protein
MKGMAWTLVSDEVQILVLPLVASPLYRGSNVHLSVVMGIKQQLIIKGLLCARHCKNMYVRSSP